MTDGDSAGDTWWLAPKAFHSLGGYYNITETQYLGGWSGHADSITSKYFLHIDKAGLTYRKFRAVFCIPWDEIVGLEIVGPEKAQYRITFTRALLVGGVLASAVKKKTQSSVLIARIRTGEEAIFHTDKLSAEKLQRILLPIITQLEQAHPRVDGPPLPAGPSPTPDPPAVSP
jgi:hypothetical protein